MDLDQAACSFGHISPNDWGGRGLQVGFCACANMSTRQQCNHNHPVTHVHFLLSCCRWQP